MIPTIIGILIGYLITEAYYKWPRIRVYASYDHEETIEGCTVQVLTNTKTGAQSFGWWRGTKNDIPILKGDKL